MRFPNSMLRLAAVCAATTAMYGQTTFATITGKVVDPGGAVVAGAMAEATHLASNYRYTATSNEAGVYTLAQLREGEYLLRVRAAGFKEFQAREIRLATLEVRRIDARLEIGAVETRVEVTAGATLIETETPRVSDSKNSRGLQTLPMNTRSLWDFVGLSPGVVQAGAGSSTRRFAGSRANQSDASIDGITISNQFDGTQISPLVSNIESFEEVRVDMANNTAEYGAIGQVTIVSKSGSNEFHGTAFDYYSTPWFRARNPFALQRGTGVRHEPGAAGGGPLMLPGLYHGANRSFFFGSFETSRGSSALQLLNPTVAPTPWRSGDFSRLAPATTVVDPFAGRAPFAGNRIPASRISPVSQRIQERFYPLPNFGDPTALSSQNYREQKLRSFDPNTYYTVRGDHRFTEKAFVFGRWTWNRSHSRAYEGNLPTIGTRWQTRDTRAFHASYTQTIRPTLINEFRWGLAYNDNPRNGPLLGKEVTRDLGIQGLVDGLPDINGVLNVGFSGIGLTGITQTQWRHPGFKNFAQQFQEQVSWFRGRHSLKAGLLLNRVKFEDMQASSALFGNVQFSNRFTGHPYADFLLGIPTTASRAAPPIFIDRLRWSWDFFLTDDFKLTPRLTLSLGARYEIHPAWTEATGRQAIFDIGSGKIVVPDGALDKVSPLLPRGYVEVIEARAAGLPSQTLLKTDRNNIAPRIGLAFRPWSNNTVFRAGYGIFYDVIPRAVGAGGAPFVINEPSFTNPTPVPTLLFPRVFPGSVAGPTSVGLPSAIRTDLRDPYSMQYNLTIEHQRWNTGFRISYIGTNTRQGEWGYNINQPLPDNRPYVDKPRLFPRYPAITYLSNGAGHQYHSLTVETERRWARGLGYQLSWVWARDIGDLERGESPENAYDRLRERGVWLDIPTHRLTGNLAYELPFGRGKRFLGSPGRLAHAIAGGWEINAIYSLYSGQFLTPTWTLPDPVGTAFTSSRTPAQVTIRANHLRNANLPTEQRTVNRWFDAGAFSAPAPGAYGTSAKGVILGPGSNIFNFGMGKSFDIGERLRLRWEMTSTNFFNHPNWANPGTNISSAAQVGVISGVGGVANLDPDGPRAFRMGIRVDW